jgi:choline dehydrogenase
MTELEYDYVVIGAGSGGCVVASRLSEDPSVKVLLIEYGGSDRNVLFRIPKAFYFTLSGDRFAYHYPTEPVGPKGQIEEWTRGKVVGGSSSVNGMMYTRGDAPDYDALVERGNPGWGWDTMLPIFKSMEDHALGASEVRGAGGPLHVSVADNLEEVTDATLKSAENLGWERSPDTNENDNERIGFAPSTVKNGMRVSAASAFLKPALRRPNLTLVTRTRAQHLLFDGKRAIGVRAATKDGSTRDYRARREVILALGVLESPQLLERSGIGRPDVLAAAGVPLRVESPNVGERMIEQRAVICQYKLKRNIGHNPLLNTKPRRMWTGAKYVIQRKGPLATGAYELTSFFKSSPEVDRPDIQGLFGPLALDFEASGLELAKHAGVMFLGYQLRPTTESSIHIRGSLAENLPKLDAHFLETDIDRKVTSKILGRARDVITQGPLADLIDPAEEAPGPGVSSEEEVIQWSMDAGAGVYHAIGSCGMGPGDDDVVDSELRVRGVEALRVVDASVFPSMPSGNTSGPVMALAWRAAGLIRATG